MKYSVYNNTVEFVFVRLAKHFCVCSHSVERDNDVAVNDVAFIVLFIFGIFTPSVLYVIISYFLLRGSLRFLWEEHLGIFAEVDKLPYER